MHKAKGSLHFVSDLAYGIVYPLLPFGNLMSSVPYA